MLLIPQLFFQFLQKGLENVGLNPQVAVSILVLIVVGSLFNIPLSKRMSINAGGALIPLLLAAYFFLKVPFGPAMIAVVIMVMVGKLFSRVVPGRGVVLSPFFPAIIAVFVAFMIAPLFAARIAFISGVLGIIIGADLLNTVRILRKENGVVLSIGGAGVFDGIFLISVLSALIAGL